MSQQLSKEAIEIFDAIAAILLRCFIVTFLALLFVWILIVFQRDYFYQIQRLFVNVSHQDFDLFVLYSLTLMKILNVVLFLFPFIAIKLLLRRQKNN
ncbi:MAG: DUF6868 family protein [Cyanobacteria bacterium P01_G01_bin.67]